MRVNLKDGKDAENGNVKLKKKTGKVSKEADLQPST